MGQVIQNTCPVLLCKTVSEQLPVAVNYDMIAINEN